LCIVIYDVCFWISTLRLKAFDLFNCCNLWNNVTNKEKNTSQMKHLITLNHQKRGSRINNLWHNPFTYIFFNVLVISFINFLHALRSRSFYLFFKFFFFVIFFFILKAVKTFEIYHVFLAKLNFFRRVFLLLFNGFFCNIWFVFFFV
jgi:hypothetical protein